MPASPTKSQCNRAHVNRSQADPWKWLLGVAASLLMTNASMAAVVMGIPTLPPGLGPFRGQSGLVESEIRLSGGVSTFHVAPDNVSLVSLADGYELTSRNYDSDPLTEARATGVASNGYSASADSTAIASPGTLRATSIARVARPDLRGQSFAHARTSASFTDVLVIGSNGLPQTDTENDGLVDFRVKLALGGSLSKVESFSGGGAVARAQVWLFPYIPAATQVSNFNQGLFLVQYHEFGEHALFADGSTPSRSIVQGSFENLPEGSSWWIHALLETEAATGFNNSNFLGRNDIARADYSHTLEVLLEPGPRNPNAQFTSVSGATYRAATPLPVDAPGTAICLVGLLALLRLHRPPRRAARARG